MDRSPPPSLTDQFAAALDWWREAGVDADYAEVPANLLAAPPGVEQPKGPASTQAKAEVAPPPPSAMGGPASGWPTALAGFPGWWLDEPSLGSGKRVPPRGVAQAELLVLVPMPEREDGDTLLSGRQGTLVASMLRAMGVAQDKAYVASALPAHTPVADWQGLNTAGLGEVLRHHLALAQPQRLLVLGQDVLPLLGLEKRQGVRDLPLAESSLPLLASFAPDILLTNARYRADLWRRWLDWTGTA